MYNFHKLIFYIMMMLGIFLSISSSSWLVSWMGLELNLMSIVPLMKTKSLKNSSEATIKYFITQAMASSILLFSVILESNMMTQAPFMIMGEGTLPMFFIMSALLMKMGAAPFHSWLPEVTSGLTWMMVFIVLTIQKLAPMILIMYLMLKINFLYLAIITSSFLGALMGLNQVCLKKILTYSSINHIGWMLAALLCSLSTWLIYYFIYCSMNICIIMILNYFKISYLNQLSQIFPFNKLFKILFLMNFLSLGGLPPFLGFMPKWISINQLIDINLHMIAFLLIMSSLISLYFYLRVTFLSFTILTFEKNIRNKFSKISNLMVIPTILPLISLPMYIIVNLLY